MDMPLPLPSLDCAGDGRPPKIKEASPRKKAVTKLPILTQRAQPQSSCIWPPASAQRAVLANSSITKYGAEVKWMLVVLVFGTSPMETGLVYDTLEECVKVEIA